MFPEWTPQHYLSDALDDLIRQTRRYSLTLVCAMQLLRNYTTIEVNGRQTRLLIGAPSSDRTSEDRQALEAHYQLTYFRENS